MIAPYQPHGFTGYEPDRPASMPSTPRRLGETPGPPRVNPNPGVGMPASGSGTQVPAQVWRMLAEVVHLHLGDEEASLERFAYEQQEVFNAAFQREQQRIELEEIAGSLREELTLQTEQHLNHFVQQEQVCFTSHLKNVESHLQAEVANTRFRLLQKYLAKTSEVEVRAAASDNAYAQLHRELLDQRNQLQEQQTQLLEGGFHLQGHYTDMMLVNSGESCKKFNTKGCWTQNLAQPLGKLSKGRELSTRETWQSKLKDGDISMEIFDEGRAAVSTQKQEVLAERDIANQLQEHLAETLAQVDDWNFWYDQEYGSECEMAQEDQEDQEDEEEAAEVNQAQSIVLAAGQLQSTPLTPPVAQGHIPAELPPTHIPSFSVPLPPVQPNARQQPPPPPPGHLQERSHRRSLSQGRSKLNQSPPFHHSSLCHPHRCPDVGPAAPMTQEYVPSGEAQQAPMTPSACLWGGMACGLVAPTSPPAYPGGMQVGSPARAFSFTTTTTSNPTNW